MRGILCFLLFLARTNSQADSNLGALKLPEELEYPGEEDEPQTKDILVIPNHFPKDLNFFCYPRTGLQHDRLCFGQLDAFALACADDTPPLQLVPFCIAFKDQCSKVNYPQETWCGREKQQFKKFCTRHKRQSCKSCHYDLSCSCEPFECIWRRYGFETARWCQRYELFCNNKSRRDKAQGLIIAMKDSIKVHYKCFHMFNLANVICNPFRRQFDHPRCMKFLFDCELISDFEEEETPKKVTEEEGEVIVVPPSGVIPEKTAVPLTPKEKEDLKKIQVEEEKLAKEIDQAAKTEILGTNATAVVNPAGLPVAPAGMLSRVPEQPFGHVTLPPLESGTSQPAVISEVLGKNTAAAATAGELPPETAPLAPGAKPAGTLPRIPEQPFEHVTLPPLEIGTERPAVVVSQPPSPHAVGPITKGLPHPLERITLSPLLATDAATPVTVPSSAAPVLIAHSPLGEVTHPDVPKNPFHLSR